MSLLLAVEALGFGALIGLSLGPGGCFLIVPALVVVLGLPMRLAVGTSLLAIALNAVWGLLGYLRFGELDWGLPGLFAIGGLFGVVLVGRLAGQLPERRSARRLPA